MKVTQKMTSSDMIKKSLEGREICKIVIKFDIVIPKRTTEN